MQVRGGLCPIRLTERGLHVIVQPCGSCMKASRLAAQQPNLLYQLEAATVIWRHQQTNTPHTPLSICLPPSATVCSCRAYTLPDGASNGQPVVTYEDGVDWGNGFVGQ